MQLHIESVPVQALKPAALNARIHDKRQINQLVSSIQTFGFLVPVLIDRNNTLIAGHGRVLAASALQMEQVPAIRIEHLSPAQQRAYLIADNKLTENAKWDRALLAREFEDLLELDLDFSIEVTGFNTSEIDAIIDEQLHIGDDAADVPTGAAPARCQAGDLWQCGEHRVLCGDALQPESYKRLLVGEQAQLILTDPPYNVAIDGHVCGAGKIRHREFAMAAGEMSQTEFTQFLQSVFTLLRQHSGNGSLHYVFMDWRHLREILTAGYSAYDELKNRRGNLGCGAEAAG